MTKYDSAFRKRTFALQTFCALFICMAWSSVGVADDAALLAKARDLLVDKKYEEVDKSLSGVLSRKTPPAEALDISYQAAMASGRFFTAQARNSALLEIGGDKDPKVVYQGVQLALLTGNREREAELLALYTEINPQRDDTYKTALLRLMKLGVRPEAIHRFIKAFGDDDSVFDAAVGMLPKLRSNRQADDFAALADLLLSRFENDAARAAVVHGELWSAAQAGLFQGLSSESEEIKKLETEIEKTDREYETLGEGAPAWADAWKAERQAMTQSVEHVTCTPWSMVGPFAADTYPAAFAKSFDPEKNPGQISLTNTFENGRLKWIANKPFIDGRFNGIAGRDASAFYLYRCIEVEKKTGISMKLGADDGMVVWLNGQKIYSIEEGGDAKRPKGKAVADLLPGKNHLLMKVVNNTGLCGFYFDAPLYGMPLDILAAICAEAPERTDGQRVSLREYYRSSIATNGPTLAEAIKIQRSVLDAVTSFSKPFELTLKYRIFDPNYFRNYVSRTPAYYYLTIDVLLKANKKNDTPLFGDTLSWFHGAWQSKEKRPAGSPAAFLSFEERYKNNRDTHLQFANTVLTCTNAFAPLVNYDKAESMLGDVLDGFKDNPSAVASAAALLMYNYCGNNVDLLARALNRFAPCAVNTDTIIDLINRSVKEGISNKDRFALALRLVPDRDDVHMRMLNLLHESKDAATMVRVVRAYMLHNPGVLDYGRLIPWFFASNIVPEADKLGVLTELYQKAGYSQAFQKLIDGAARYFKESVAFKTFVASINKQQMGTDPILAAHARLWSDPLSSRNIPDPKVHVIAKPAFDAYGTKLGVWKPQDQIMRSVFDRYQELVRYDQTAQEEFIATVVPHLSTDGPWSGVFAFARTRSNNPELRGMVAETFVKSGGDPSILPAELIDGGVIGKLEGAWYLEPHYAKLDPIRSLHSIRVNRKLLGERVVDECAKICAANKGSKKLTPQFLYELVGFLRECSKTRKDPTVQLKIPDTIYTTLGELGVRDWIPDNYRPHVVSYLQNAGKTNEVSAYLLQAADAVSGAARIDRLNWILEYLDDKAAGTVLMQRYIPALDGLSKSECIKTKIAARVFGVIWALSASADSSDELRAQLAKIEGALLDKGKAGLPLDRLDINASNALLWREYTALKKSQDYEKMLWIAQLSAGWVTPCISQILDDLSEAQMWDILYLTAKRIRTPDAALQKRAEYTAGLAAARIPGLYPVSATQPAYDIFVASGELAIGNQARAWQLFSPRIAEFMKDPLRFDPDFTIWALDKLRAVRGEDDALIQQARDVCDQILADERDLSPEFTAAISLTKGDIFRDLKNFAAARMEYEAIRKNPGLRETVAGRRSKYRDIDLMILMGDSSGAQSQIEYWLTSPDPELQAEAHYFLALIAFEEKDYTVCREHLDRVFSINHKHLDASFLDAQWRLATNFIASHEVDLPDRFDRRLIKPGQSLTISLQDKNLSVIGQGTFIPVVVNTSVGKDRETISLYPAPRSPNVFRGTIDTTIGMVVQSNLVLEIGGEDVVTYEVDSEFLKDRGLDSSMSKQLTVADDAWVAASAGRILTEAEEQELALRRQMALLRTGKSEDEEMNQRTEARSWQAGLLSGGASGEGHSGSVRPGNPIYVMVRDLDRDVSDQADTLTVRAETSLGDSLQKVVLTETGEHSGMFRGHLPTSIPLPHAAASDTAEGKDPSVLINSTKNGVWTSQVDEKREARKWVKADLMASRLVSEATLDAPDPGSLNKLVLYGSLLGEMRLGEFPESGKESPGGLLLRTLDGASVNARSTSVRDIDEALSASVPRSRHLTAPVIPDVQKKGVAGLASGSFFLDESQYVPFTLSATNSGIVRVFVLVDGSPVLTGWVKDLALQRTAGTVFLTRGGHLLEIYYFSPDVSSGFSVGMMTDEGETVPLPEQWFNVSENPGLADYVKDTADIVRTATGFKATFRKPEALRALRWEFEEYDGTSVTVSKLGAKNDKGEVIIPVTQDYSSTLSNDSLEIAPGEEVTISYDDSRNFESRPRVRSAKLNASFFDAKAGFSYELIENTDRGYVSRFAPIYRYVPGEQILVIVSDADEDVTEKRDSVNVVVVTDSGGRIELTAQEKEANAGGRFQSEVYHTGVFLAVLKTTVDGETGENTLKVKDGDSLRVQYLDKENWNPGVAVVRESKNLPPARTTPTKLQLFHVCHPRDQIEIPAGETNAATAKLLLEQARLRKTLVTVPMSDAEMAANPIMINGEAPLEMKISNQGRALHGFSTIKVTAVSQSELDAAKREERAPVEALCLATLGQQGGAAGVFGGRFSLLSNAEDMMREWTTSASNSTIVCAGNDTIYLTVFDKDGKPEIRKTLKLATEGSIGLFDLNFEKHDADVHMGEKLYVQVEDRDRDVSDAQDYVVVHVVSTGNPEGSDVELTETLPHSGVFNGSIRTLFNGVAPQTNAADTGAVVVAVSDDVVMQGLKVGYGDTVTFTYEDTVTLFGSEPGPKTVAASVLLGADAGVAIFTKRYSDEELAARVQFRMAECLFEMAKEYRRKKAAEKAADAIAAGSLLLTETMQDYPNTSLATEGQYLLANLREELAGEEKDQGEARRLYQEAVTRFANIINTWPDSEFASQAQYHKALCLEKLGDYRRACDEFVRMSYTYPDSPLVSEATIRLATYYYKQEKRYDVAGRIYEKFVENHGSHPKAPQVLFLAAQCHLKQGEVWSDPNYADTALLELETPQERTAAIGREYALAAKLLDRLIYDMKDSIDNNFRAQAMYWSGTAYMKGEDEANAFLRFREATVSYPDTDWAKRARGVLLDNPRMGKNFINIKKD